MTDYAIYDTNQGDLIVRAEFDVNINVIWTTDEMWKKVEALLAENHEYVRRLEDAPSPKKPVELQIACRRQKHKGAESNCFIYLSRSWAEIHIPESQLYTCNVREDARRILDSIVWASSILKKLGGQLFSMGRDSGAYISYTPDDAASFQNALLHNIVLAHQEIDSDLDDPLSFYKECILPREG